MSRRKGLIGMAQIRKKWDDGKIGNFAKTPALRETKTQQIEATR
jgi:hypothetical protein